MYFQFEFHKNFDLDPPGEPNLTTQYTKNPNLDIQGVWLENHQYTVRCNSDPGNPPNKYRLIMNSKKLTDQPVYTITAKRDLHQGVLVCEVYNKFTEYRERPKSVTYNITLYCESV